MPLLRAHTTDKHNTQVPENGTGIYVFHNLFGGFCNRGSAAAAAIQYAHKISSFLPTDLLLHHFSCVRATFGDEKFDLSEEERNVKTKLSAGKGLFVMRPIVSGVGNLRILEFMNFRIKEL